MRINADSATIAHDLRGNQNTRDFEKIYAVTCVSWGRGEFRRHIALSTSGGQILLYNIDKQTTNSGGQKSVLRLTDSNRAVNSLTFSPTNGSIILSASADGGVRLWDLRTNRRKPNLLFSKPGDVAREVQCSPFDASKFAVIYDSGTIQRWDFRNSTSLERRINAHSGSGLSLDWHNEYDYIVSGGLDKQIQIWNMASESRKPAHVIISPSPVVKVRWQYDLQHSNASATYGVLNTDIASCHMSLYDYGVYVWNPRRPYIPRYIIESHTNAVTDVFWRSNNFLWTIAKDRTFRQHNLKGREMALDNMQSQALSWTHNNVLSFVVQDKHKEQYSHISDEQLVVSGMDAKRRQSGGNRTPLLPVPLPSVPSCNQAICTVAFPGPDAASFQFCAENYVFKDTFPSEEPAIHRVVEICEHNSLVASRAGLFRVAQTWRILHDIISSEKAQFLEFDPPSKKPVLGSLQPYTSRITESLKGLSSIEATPKLNPVDEQAEVKSTREMLSERSRSRSRPLPEPGIIKNRESHLFDIMHAKKSLNTEATKSKHKLKRQKASSSESDERDLISSFDSNISDGRSDSADNLGSSFTQLSLKDKAHKKSGHEKGPHSRRKRRARLPDIKEDIASALGSKVPSHTNLKALNTHPHDALFEMDENTMGKRQSSYTSRVAKAKPKGNGDQSMKSQTHDFKADYTNTDMASDSSFMSSASEEPLISSVDKHQEHLEPLSSSNSSDAEDHVHNHGASVKVVDPKISALSLEPRASITASTSEVLVKRYREYLQTLTHPWRAEKMIEQAAIYAMEQGDIQMCAMLGMLFMDDYPGAFASRQMVEEWVWTYLTLLRKHELHMACAEIIKLSPFKRVRESGQIEVQLDMLCHRCNHPLVDNAAAAAATREANAHRLEVGTDFHNLHGQQQQLAVGFWYCGHCHKLLDSCIFCRVPVKGIAVSTLECGHKLHIHCMREWINYAKLRTAIADGETLARNSGHVLIECPSGCQTALAVPMDM